MSATHPDVGVPVRDFNHHKDPALSVDPFTAFDRFRDEPIFWSTELGGFWVLTRHADIRAALHDEETFSSKDTLIPPITWMEERKNRDQQESTDWTGFHKLLVRAVAGPAGDAVTRAVQSACVRLVAGLAPRGRCELMAEFAAPVREALFAGLFDVPEAQARQCAQWTADLLQYADPERRLRAAKDFMTYLAKGITACARGTSTSTGLLHALATAEVDGRPLLLGEAVDLAVKMGIGSVDTVTNSIGFAFRHLATHPELQQRLAAEPEVAARAADELLRLHSVANVARTAARDTEIAGTRIRAGERVLLSLVLADRDPHQYPAPELADFDRPERASHLAFGAGVHRCIGARIATQTLAVALREWHAVIPAYSLAAGATPRTVGGALFSLTALPLSWAP